MRILQIGTQRHTKVVCLDEPGAGNACHRYSVVPADYDPKAPAMGPAFSMVSFQNGPIKESGVNGCHNEDLLAIVIDRLEGFQSSEYKCRENAIALTKIEEALMWLRKRTNDRMARGVEGTHTV